MSVERKDVWPKINAWAKENATHNNDAPPCYEGTCRCAEFLANKVWKLVVEDMGLVP